MSKLKFKGLKLYSDDELIGYIEDTHNGYSPQDRYFFNLVDENGSSDFYLNYKKKTLKATK